MATSIEKLLRLAADYHCFCQDAQVAPAELREEELSPEELEFIAAAGSQALWDMDDQEL